MPKGYKLNLSKEERRLHKNAQAREKYAVTSTEENRVKRNERQRKRRASLSDEERARYLETERAYKRKRLEDPAYREKINKQQRKRVATMLTYLKAAETLVLDAGLPSIPDPDAEDGLPVIPDFDLP